MKFAKNLQPGYYWVLWEGNWVPAEIFKLHGRWEAMPLGSIDTVSSREIDELGPSIVRPINNHVWTIDPANPDVDLIQRRGEAGS